METTAFAIEAGDRLSDYKKKFGEIIRFVTLSRMQLYTDDVGFEIIEMDNAVSGGTVFANTMSMIVVAGKSLRVVLKTHFNHKDSIPIARRLFGSDEIDDSRSYDVMKEYCNLSAGYLKKICIEQDVPVGISLPVVTLGFNEIFADSAETEQKLIFEDCWRLKDVESDIICSCEVDVIDPKSFDNLMDFALTEEEDEDDEYDFL